MTPMGLMRQQTEARKLGITAKDPAALSVAIDYAKAIKAEKNAAAEAEKAAADVAETARRAAAEQAEDIAMAAIIPAGPISGDENPLAAVQQTPAYAAVNALAPLTPAQELVLALADNIHDAWGGFRNKPGGAEINDVLLAIGSRRTQTAYPPINFTSMLTAYGFPNIQTSKIEATTIAHFEKNYPQIEPVSPNAVATYEQIIAAPDISTVEAGVRGLRTTYDSYVITSPNSNIETLLLDTNNQAKICAFIRTFLFGQNGGYTMYPTFDAHSGVFAKIFRDQPDMRVLITPMNVADSATTSYKKIGLEEPVFFFPETAPGRFTTTRNTLTRAPLAAAPALPAITMSYINNGFGPLMPTNFSFEIAMDGVDPITGSYQGFPQGPSLDYLIDLTLAALPPAAAGPVDFSRVQPSSSCFLVGTDIHNGTPAIRARIIDAIRAHWDAIFMDIKRMGDQDQVDAAFVANAFLGRVVLVTIDRLCALAARLKGIPCIWHDGEKIILYKNHRMDTTLTPEEIAKYEATKAEKFVGENTAMYNYITRQEALDQIEAFAGSIPFDPAVPSLLQHKFGDMRRYLASAHAALSAYIAQPNIALTGVPATDATTINNLFEALGNSNIDPRAAVDIYTFISGAIVPFAPFNKLTDYPFLNYSYKKFKEVKSSFDTIRNTVLSVRPRREPIDFGAALNGPDGYNTLVTRIIDSLLIDGGEEALKSAYLLLPADLNAFQASVNIIDKYLEAEKSNPAAKGGLKAAAMAASDAIKASLIARFPVAVGTDDPRVMIGGALEDNIALFKDICEQAANVVNVAVAAVAPVIRQQYALKRFLYEYRLFLRNQKRDNTLLVMALQTMIREGVTIAGNPFLAILPAETPNAYLARLNAQPWFNLASIQAQINAYAAPGGAPGPDQAFYDALPAATFENLLESLKNQWGDRYRAIDILLEPYAGDGNLKLGHPLYTLFGAPDPTAVSRATAYSLFVLTELNDIFQGKVRNNTSILPSLFGGFPASLKYYTLTIPKEWSNLPRIIDALTRMTAAGRFSNEPLRLFAGGTRKRSSKKGRKTMRNRKRRTIRNRTHGSSNKRKTIRHHQ